MTLTNNGSAVVRNTLAEKCSCFPLTPAEREQPLNIFLNLEATGHNPVADLPRRWKQFSLSAGERAGVRGKATLNQTPAIIC